MSSNSSCCYDNNPNTILNKIVDIRIAKIEILLVLHSITSVYKRVGNVRNDDGYDYDNATKQ